jgi:hypothetical protein
MKTLREYTPPPRQFLLSVERIAKLILKKSVGQGGRPYYYYDFWASQLIKQ